MPVRHMAEPALAVSGLVTGYGSTEVLASVSVDLPEDGVLALLGRNGMGKSTLARAIAGLLPAWQGSIHMLGRDVTAAAPVARVAAGLAYAPQERALFQDLSVRDNLRLALRSDRALRARLDQVLPLFPVLGGRLRQRAGTLSGGEQKMLLLARALLPGPRLLVLDEISEGLQPSVVDAIAGTLRERVQAGGLSVLLIEQNIAFALKVAQRWAVLERGDVVAKAETTDVDSAAKIARLLAL